MDGDQADSSRPTLNTGSSHRLVLCGPGAALYSDFDHKGRVEDSPEERAAHAKRPGSILLPVFRASSLRDEYLTPVHVRPLGQPPPEGSEFVLQFEHVNDRKRVVVYTEENRKRVLGLNPQLDTVQIPVSPNWTGEHFLLHALTLAGDPRRPSPSDPSPRSPLDPSTPIYDTIEPGEVWIRLHPRHDGPDHTENDDIALFLIAPFLLQSNLALADRLYLISRRVNHNSVYDIMEACWTAFETGPFDRNFGLEFPASLPRRRSQPEGPTIDTPTVDAPGNALLSPDTMYLINGDKYLGDAWVQDSMAIGYCSAPGDQRAFNVALHCKRRGGLSNFVADEMRDPDDRLFVFDALFESGPERDTTDYGGNIAVSPPVHQGTESDPKRRAGPPVPAHPPAPHGKIILGDCDNPDRSRSGLVHNETRHFLQSQTIQPIVPIDTSWLAVGHVDEIMGFVPTAPPSTRSAQLAMASPRVMDQLLRETKKVPMEEGRTHFHRGRHNEHHTLLKHVIGDNPERVVEGRDKSVRELFVESYAETRLETLYDGRARTVSRRLRTRFLRPIERRICQCTGLTSPDDVVRLPVYFDYYNPTQRTQSWGQALADSCTSNLVNMQVLNTDPDPHLLVPRPCGPRLPPEQTEDVVRSVLEEIGRGVPHVCRPQDKRDNQPGFPFWVWPNLTIDTLALFFTRRKQGGAFITDIERDQLIRLIKQGHAVHHLRGDLRKAVEATRRKILDANDLPPALLQNGRFTRWHRLFIPEDTVDVLEAYTQSVLEAIGCHVHFVDAWYYHSGHGGLHCATNVRHRPPATDAPEREGRPPWWATYPDLADANTIYDPHNTAHVERAQQHASP